MSLQINTVVCDMSLGSTKCSYSLAFELGPHYHSELVKDIQREYFTLIVDETTTQQSKKQLDLHTKYWSYQENKVTTRYFGSCFLGHATADIMKKSVVETLSVDSLSLQKMIMLSCDGPNINISLKKKLDVDIKTAGGQTLVDIGPCTLHIVHNAFRAGLAAVPHWEIDEFVIYIFYWFKNYPS